MIQFYSGQDLAIAKMLQQSSFDRSQHFAVNKIPRSPLLQVQLQLVTATVKLFLKKPTERPQQMIQLVLTYATQETDNPDLRDRAYVYW